MPPFDVPEGDPFGPHNLPYGVFSIPGSLDRTDRTDRTVGDRKSVV